jgi:hypothetical protein
MYKIIGADQKEYGPVTAEQLRQWVVEGRVNGQTSIWAEGATDWKPLSAFPEFATLLGAKPPVADVSASCAAQPGLPPDIFTRDYDLDIGRCVSDGYNLLKNNFGIVFGGAAIFMVIELFLGGLAQIPLVGLVFTVGNLIISGPLTGGVYFLFLKVIRRQPAEIGDVFAGFRQGFGQLLLGYLVVAILSGLSAVPGMAIMGVPIFLMVRHHAVEAGPLLVAILGFIVAMIPAIYLGTCWMFSLPLIIDKQMEFWPAMSASRRMVAKHWWLVFGLMVVCGLINLAGFAACCVGIFFSLPIVFGAMMHAYESIFSAPASRPA